MIRTWSKAERQRTENQGGQASRLLDQALRHAGMALMLTVLTRAAPLGYGTPFALAAVSAALLAGKSPWPMLIGILMGCPWIERGLFALAPAGGAVLIVLMHRVATRLPFFETHEGGVRQRDLLAAAMAGLAALLSGLTMMRDLPYDLIMTLINAALALATAPALVSAMNMKWSRSRLLPEEQISLGLLALCLLVGLRLIPGIGQNAAHLAAVLATLTGALCSMGAGAVCGVLAGSALVLLGDVPYVGVALALCGLLAGVVRRLGRPAMALSFSLGNAISLIYSSGEQLGVISPYIALLGGVALCFLPYSIVETLGAWFAPKPAVADADRLANHLRQDAESRVRALGLLFDEMSRGYETPSPLPDEQELVMQMRQKLCEGCSQYEKCWSGANSRAGRLLVELLSDALCGRVIEAGASELPPDVCRKCKRAAQIPKKLGPMLSGFDEKRRAARERGECKALLSSQFRYASDALMAEGDRLARPMRFDRELADRACAALDQEGLDVSGVWAVEDDLPRLFIALRDKNWGRSRAGRATRALSESLGIPIKTAATQDGAQEGELCFVPAPRMNVDVGFAGRAGAGGTTSGDSHLTSALSDGRVLLALSDGMGSGARAQAESASALRLLKKLLAAGVSTPMALDAINELLLLRSGDEMFATADLCLLDPDSCRAEFSKLGSCASLILRRDRILRIEGGRLPMGVLGKVSPMETNVRLQDGDLIVMVTDGVLENAKEDQMEWLESMVRRYRDEPPQKLCERLVSLSVGKQGKKKDDMTALCAKITVA